MPLAHAHLQTWELIYQKYIWILVNPYLQYALRNWLHSISLLWTTNFDPFFFLTCAPKEVGHCEVGMVGPMECVTRRLGSQDIKWKRMHSVFGISLVDRIINTRRADDRLLVACTKSAANMCSTWTHCVISSLLSLVIFCSMTLFSVDDKMEWRDHYR